MDATILNVTVNSLATHVGVIDDGRPDHGDVARSRLLNVQLGILQSKPRNEQTRIYHEFAAKYLPALAEKYRANSGPLNSSMKLLNVITYTPYFVRFARTPAGQGLAALQAKRTAQAVSEISNMGPDEVGEIGQFLATLLLLQGTAGVDASDKSALVPKLKQWKRTYAGRLASDTSERCLALLMDDPSMRPMMQHVKKMLEGCLQKCGGPNCERTQQTSGDELMQCARCKSAVYCGSDHQKNAWPLHKATCFAPSF